MMLEEGLAMREDAGRGWRRVVPSPEPKEIVEIEAIRDLVEDGVLVVCSGGGGVPVVRRRGALSGIDAVIDKDLAAALLATRARRRRPAHPHRRPAGVHPLQHAPAAGARHRLGRRDGGLCRRGPLQGRLHGPQGRRLPAVRDAGGDAVIASLTEVVPALHGTAGTRIVGAALPISRIDWEVWEAPLLRGDGPK